MTSPLRLLLKDGTKDAQIIDGKILAPGSKFDGLKATESNLTKALFSSGSKPTNIQDYVVTPNAGEQILPDGTPLPMTDPRFGKLPPGQPGTITGGINTGPGYIPPTDQIMQDGTRMRPDNLMYGKPPGDQSSLINKDQRKQLTNLAMMSQLGLI
jgi:hypothetical protein